MTKRDGKIIAATVTVFGVIFNILGNKFGTPIMAWNAPTWYGAIFEKLGFYLPLFAPIIYIYLDWGNLFPSKNKKKEEDTGKRTDKENIKENSSD